MENSFIREDKDFKIVNSKNYNYIFNKNTGLFVRTGETKDDDPYYCEFGPEILDIEISEVCTKGCKFCYKDNTSKGKNMSLDTIKIILDKVPKTVCQIAYGIGDISGNPELFDILKYTKEKGIIPNITINGRITEDESDNLLKYVGAVAVSMYDENECFNAVELLTNKGLKQCNMHYMLSQQTFDKAFKVLNSIKNDYRLKKLNAIVFLSLKKKGRAAKNFDPCTNEQFKELVTFCLENKINFGFDSCSAQKFNDSIKGLKNEKELLLYSEACESTLFSLYINTNGEVSPCSFCEGTENWKEGIKIDKNTDFLNDIWYDYRILKFRNDLLACGRNCPIYKI